MIFRSRFPDVPIPNVALHEFVLGRASRQPDAIALVDATTGRALTYAQLTDQVRRLAAGLAARGIRKGDVLAIWSPNIPEYAVVFQTVSRIGAIISTANPTYTPEELAFQLNDANARMLITIGPLVERAREAIAAANRSIELVTIDPVAGVTSLASLMVDAEPPAVAIDPANDVVVLPYSSGTTGLPKGVMLTHRNLVS
jgi:acyl-CoA synthetase (AMP-forming)/AMP-acid ligase II